MPVAECLRKDDPARRNRPDDQRPLRRPEYGLVGSSLPLPRTLASARSDRTLPRIVIASAAGNQRLVIPSGGDFGLP